HRFDQEPSAGTRFGSASRVNGGRLFKRYWHREVFAAVDLLTEAAAKEGISLTEATHRWLRHHSGLGEGDAVLVGVSSLKQLEQNLDDLEMGPLPADLVDAFEEAWKVVEHLQIISIPSALDKEG
ncbi:Aflatoxin B1 aldehyde reductase member 2, partial [Actinomortierella ambigua]